MTDSGKRNVLTTGGYSAIFLFIRFPGAVRMHQEAEVQVVKWMKIMSLLHVAQTVYFLTFSCWMLFIGDGEGILKYLKKYWVTKIIKEYYIYFTYYFLSTYYNTYYIYII